VRQTGNPFGMMGTYCGGRKGRGTVAGREEQAGGSPEGAIRFRDWLVVALALTSGAVDAVTFVRLGKVFSSVITGNLALLGIAAGQREGSLAVTGGLALTGYGLGVVVGRVIVGASADQRIWPRRTTVALAAELLVLAGFSAGWLATSGSPAGGPRVALVMAGAAAMGMQASAVRRLGPMSSTYLTSTLTGMLEALALRRWPQDWQRGVGVILALVVGATFGAAAAASAESLAPVAVLVPLAVVVGCAARSASLGQRPPAARQSRPVGPGQG
jgi:uncharacterized membrane protein YoaK (UPF0700 family)